MPDPVRSFRSQCHRRGPLWQHPNRACPTPLIPVDPDSSLYGTCLCAALDLAGRVPGDIVPVKLYAQTGPARDLDHPILVDAV
jgi:hypothetical protein